MSTNAATRNRRPAGTPTGGQFAPGSHAEPEITLGTLPNDGDDGRVNEFVHKLLTDDGYDPDGEPVFLDDDDVYGIVSRSVAEAGLFDTPDGGVVNAYRIGGNDGLPGSVVFTMAPAAEDDPAVQYTQISGISVELRDLKLEDAGVGQPAVDAYRHVVDATRDEVRSLSTAYERLYGDRARDDAATLDRIAQMLQDPEWGSGMLEDIADLVGRTGRDMTGDGGPTWDRH